jgi:hypothetical protein
MSDKPIVPVPAPWKLKGTVYIVSYWTKAGKLPDFTYSPLEAKSPYSDPEASGQHQGGISQFQIIRYSESPVGPYDELIICPGYFDYKVEEGGKLKTKKNPRITRIYVSQKYTCWNGRKSQYPQDAVKRESASKLTHVDQIGTYPNILPGLSSTVFRTVQPTSKCSRTTRLGTQPRHMQAACPFFRPRLSLCAGYRHFQFHWVGSSMLAWTSLLSSHHFPKARAVRMSCLAQISGARFYPSNHQSELACHGLTWIRRMRKECCMHRMSTFGRTSGDGSLV